MPKLQDHNKVLKNQQQGCFTTSYNDIKFNLHMNTIGFSCFHSLIKELLHGKLFKMKKYGSTCQPWGLGEDLR